jgi:asparagine synthase (glutamine-hydrolysing)
MCGIAGRFNFRNDAPVDLRVLNAMSALLAHRGPDGCGVHADGSVGLAHRRLAVIDLSDAGCQPMSYGDDLWITYNGEIYNFPWLRTELEKIGCVFRTQSDTEVILAAYRVWGADCVKKLRGMFAFAIWDGPARTLLLARDRIGKKPLYYRLDQEGLAFASEPKAFLAEPGFAVAPEPQSLLCYLALQYVPAPRSAFAGVSRLPPAHVLIVNRDGVRMERYWRLSFQNKRHIKEADATDELFARLKHATSLRLISDVPLGAFLSGGIDSGLTVAMMAQLGAGRVRTFSIGFEERRYDELRYAAQVAHRFGTEHHELVVKPDVLAILPKLIWHYNEPYADSSAIPTWYLADMTRRSVTVALTGDGGDESFAGYDRYTATRLAGWYDRLPRGLASRVQRAVTGLPPMAGLRSWTRLQRFAAALPQPREQRYASLMTPFSPRDLSDLCQPEFLHAAGDIDPMNELSRRYAESDATDFIDATLDVDVNTYLPDDLLVKVDIATMAHGLEARNPFLDHELMEFAASLPSTYKLHGLTQKYLLKMAARPVLPAEVVDRPKRGFAVPIDTWFRGPLRPFLSDVLLDSTARGRGYFRQPAVERMIHEHTTGVRKRHHQLWSLLVFELWHRMFVDQRPDGPPGL